ncbi:MAG: SIMPL domain-containing protein [Gemmatimonadetes bacterium]|nr:SIMPL domain-containing protein [Gemmatimonadota bacterium]
MQSAGRKVLRDAVLVVCLGSWIPTPAAGQFLPERPDSGSIAVTATSEVRAAPARVVLHAAFQGEGPDAEQAVAGAVAARDRAMAALRDLGLPAEAVTPMGAGFGAPAPGPMRGRPDPSAAEPRQAILGLSVEVQPFSRLDAVLSALAGAGMQSLTFLSVEPEDEDAAVARATRDAVTRARAQAEAMAAAAGARLGPLRSLVAYPDHARVQHQMMAYGGGFERWARLIPGESVVRATVHVTWHLVR